MKVGHQGIFGAFSYIAAKELYPKAKILNYKTFSDVVEAVSNSEIDFGIIPFENSIAGRVADVYNIFANTKLYIVKEKLLKISHNLVGIKKVNFDSIRYVHSHEQALKQCEKTIKKLIPNAILVKEENTAVAAELVSKMDSSHTAICSEESVKSLGLEILRSDFQDEERNCTLFVSLSNKENTIPKEAKGVITSLLFEVNNKPSALYNALGCFARREINMLKLESYIPNAVSSSNASFFVTIEGNVACENIKLALNDLKNFTNSIHSFGSFLMKR